VPNIKISLPSIVVEAIAASTKMNRIAWTRNIAVCFVPDNTIGACDIGDITTDYIVRSVLNPTRELEGAQHWIPN